MWIVYSVLCMVVLTAADIIANRAVSLDELAPIKLRITVMGFAFVMGLAMYALGLGESGLAPWVLIVKHPLILVIVACVVLSELLYLVSLKFIGMSIMEAITGLEGIVIFLGMLLANTASGRMGAIQDMFAPVKLVLIVVVLVFTILLPNVELMAEKKRARRDLKIDTEEKAKPVSREETLTREVLVNERNTNVIGIVIALIAVIFGAGDSLLGGIILDGGDIGAIDTSMTYCFGLVLPLPFFIIAFMKKRKQMQSDQNKFDNTARDQATYKVIDRVSVIYAILFVVQMLLGVFALSIDAVRSEILFFSYPAIAIIAAKIFLKEKYTWRQNLCIWVITIATIAFCVIS